MLYWTIPESWLLVTAHVISSLKYNQKKEIDFDDIDVISLDIETPTFKKKW